MPAYRATTRRHLSTSPFAAQTADAIKTFDVGERVSHDREGLGRVHSIEHDGAAVIVDFGGGRLVRQVAPFAKLHTL
ncbi:hypothetical protein GCM10009630_69810 [Kribbella jejuensis]|uniref:Uncharacterized protein n=1 Tax=Kribbella jejuensis TaxID=236068 RepID=A0A542DUB2_9ACTN|nr:hypothetical protein [Kribbella jejuensis]TQJ06701.1 hypothetical protein FB475_6367 [Kribbella jejuensis]